MKILIKIKIFRVSAPMTIMVMWEFLMNICIFNSETPIESTIKLKILNFCIIHLFPPFT
jgi:hypothetical protein